MTSLALNLLDELYLNLDRKQEPWTVHYELRVDSHLDPVRLAAAIGAAARRHPQARARLASWRLQDNSYDWEIAEELEARPGAIRADVLHEEGANAVQELGYGLAAGVERLARRCRAGSTRCRRLCR